MSFLDDVYVVGEIRVKVGDILNNAGPTLEELKTLKESLERSRKWNASLYNAVVTCADLENHVWINLALALISERLKRVSNFADILFCSPDWISAIPEEFCKMAMELDAEQIAAYESEYFHVGKNWVKQDVVCRTNAPSTEQLSTVWKVLGTMLSVKVPIEEAIKIVGESVVEHPWLIMFLDIALKKIKIGDSIASGIKTGIEEFESKRIEIIANTAIAESVESTYVSRPPSSGNRKSLYYLPNFCAAINYDLQLIDVGEEVGELDSCLLNLAELKVSFKKLWDDDVSSFFKELFLLNDTGLSILRSLKMIESRNQKKMRNEISKICRKIECGCTFSEACMESGGKLSHPVIIAILQAGEKGGAIETIFLRLSEM